MLFSRKLLVAVASMGVAGPVLQGATVQFIEGGGNAFVANYTGVQDAEIFGYSGSLFDFNSGATNGMQIGTGNANQARKLLVRFDGLNVMAGQYASITSAKLVLRNLGSANGGGAFDVSVYQISDANAAWNQGTKAIAAATAGDVTWNNRVHGSAAWAGSSGLSTATTDYVATALDTTTVNYNTPSSTLWEWDLPPSLVNQWITGGVNAGLLVTKANESDATYWGVETSEGSAGPRLVIEYTEVPEPAAIALVLPAMLAIRRKR